MSKIILFAVAVALILFGRLEISRASEEPSSEQRVKATASGPAQAVGGKSFDLIVSLEVQQGYHIQANTAKDPYIPTTIAVTAPAGLKVGAASFPTAKTEEFFGEKLKVFDGKIAVKVPVVAPPATKGKQEFSIKVGYQACNQSACDPPAFVSTACDVILTSASASPTPRKPSAKKAPHK